MDVDAFQLSAVVSGHEQDVRSVGGFGDLLLTASRDASVRVWKRADAGSAFVCAHTLLGHTDWVLSTCALGVGVASGSKDTSVIVWDLTTAAPRLVLQGHSKAVSCVRAAPPCIGSTDPKSTKSTNAADLLYSASWDHTAKCWALDGREEPCLVTFEGHTNALWGLLPLEGEAFPLLPYSFYSFFVVFLFLLFSLYSKGFKNGSVERENS